MPQKHRTVAVPICITFRVKQVLAERGENIRILGSRSPAERNLLGDCYLVEYLRRHVIVRDHVDLTRFVREIGASEQALSVSVAFTARI